MDRVYVLNQALQITGVIDNYISLIWRPSYSGIGDFELYLGADKNVFELFTINHYLVRSSDITVNAGVTTIHKVMIIKNIEIQTDVENGNYFVITGKELKYLLHQRIVWSQTNLTGYAENAIRTLITQNAISPSNSNRVIPLLALDSSAGLTDSINKQLTGDYLDTAITDICVNYNYGWELYVNDGQIKARVYTGLDRSFDQTDRPYVVFSESFENLYNTDYQLNTEDYANTTLVGGEGEGTAKKYVTVNDTNTGLARFETYTDGSDISSNDGQITSTQYLNLLRERGAEALAELKFTEGLTGEVYSDGTFKYGVDFNLGDIVTVINEYGISKNVRVLSAIESADINGTRLIPQFNL